MADENQYRVKGNGANMRDEPALGAKIATTLSPGTIVTVDPGRTTDKDKDGHHWYPVVVLRGWVRDDTVEVLKGE